MASPARSALPISLLRFIPLALVLCLAPAFALASSETPNEWRAPADDVSAVFSPGRHETGIRAPLAQDLCVAMRLPEEWRASQDDHGIRLRSTEWGSELSLSARSASELRTYPRAGAAARDALALQREYEEMLGKPAQSLAHEPTGYPGVSRWSAMWIDMNFAAASRALSIETYIVETNGPWTVELTFANVGAAKEHDAEVGRMLSSLQVTLGRGCALP